MFWGVVDLIFLTSKNKFNVEYIKTQDSESSSKLYLEQLLVETTASNLSDEYSETDEEELDIITTEQDSEAPITEK